MKGMIQIKAGLYDLSDATRMSIHASDDGAVVTVCHRPTGVRSISVIDKCGTVVRRAASHQMASSSVPHDCFEESKSRIEILSKMLKVAPKPKRRPKLIRFTLITTGRSSRRRNRPYVVAGFSNSDVTHVAYRISGEQVDRQLRLEGKLQRGQPLSACRAGMGKMTRAETAEVIRDRVYTVVQAEVDIPSIAELPKRGSRAKPLSKATKRQRRQPEP